MVKNNLFIGVIALMALGFCCLRVATGRMDHHLEYRLGFTSGYREAYPAAVEIPEPRKPDPRRRNWFCGFADGFNQGSIDNPANNPLATKRE